MIITNLKDVRVNSNQGMILLKRSIISRDMLPKSGDYITIDNCSFAFANRVNKFADLEVKNNDNWIFVNNNDTEYLYEVFTKKEIKDQEVLKVEQYEEPIPEVEDEPIIEEEPVVEEETTEQVVVIDTTDTEETSEEIEEPIAVSTPNEEETEITADTEIQIEDEVTIETTTSSIEEKNQMQYRPVHIGKNKKKHH